MKNIGWMVLLPGLAWAQVEEDALQRVDQRFQEQRHFGTVPREHFPRYKMPNRFVPMDDILRSPVEQKAVEANRPIQDIRTNTVEILSKSIVINVHTLPDENGFFYIQERNGNVHRRISTKYAISMKPVTEMYEPPRQYSAITKPRNMSPYDPQVRWLPEFNFGMGQTQSRWTADILDASEAREAIFTRLGVSALIDWKEQYQLGGTFQYEFSSHDTPYGSAAYTSPSIGVVGKTKRLETGNVPWRLGAQLRLAPLGNLQVPRSTGTSTIKTRSYALQLSWESPHKNRYGEWAWGVLVQREWAKVTQQTEKVSLDAETKTNDQIGLFISQGFTW